MIDRDDRMNVCVVKCQLHDARMLNICISPRRGLWIWEDDKNFLRHTKRRRRNGYMKNQHSRSENNCQNSRYNHNENSREKFQNFIPKPMLSKESIDIGVQTDDYTTVSRCTSPDNSSIHFNEGRGLHDTSRVSHIEQNHYPVCKSEDQRPIFNDSALEPNHESKAMTNCHSWFNEFSNYEALDLPNCMSIEDIKGPIQYIFSSLEHEESPLEHSAISSVHSNTSHPDVFLSKKDVTFITRVNTVGDKGNLRSQQFLEMSNDEKYLSLVDTGAGINVMSTYRFSRIDPCYYQIMHSDVNYIQGVNNKLQKIAHKIKLRFSLSGKHFTAQFYIADISYQAILGMEFLRSNLAQIDVDSFTIRLNGDYFELHKPQKSDRTTNKAICALSYVIPPMSCKEIEVELNPNFSSIAYMIQPNSPAKHNITVLPAIADTRLTKVQLMNNTDKRIRIKKGDIIGSLVDVSVDNMVDIDTFTTIQSTGKCAACFIDESHAVHHDQYHNIKSDIRAFYEFSQIKDYENNCSDSMTEEVLPTLPVETKDNNRLSDIELNVGDKVLSPSDRQRVIEFLKENYDVFATEHAHLGKCVEFTHEIELKPGVQVTQCRPYKMHAKLARAAQNEINLQKDKGMIVDSDSVFSSPCLVVWRPDGRIRLCVDYRALNKTVKRVSYPLPSVQSMIEKISERNASWYSSCDIYNSFHCIPVTERSSGILSFVHNHGSYRPKFLPYGYVNSSSLFLLMISKMLEPLMRDSDDVLFYCDDVIIMVDTLEQFFDIMTKIFQQCRKFGVTLNALKSYFVQLVLDFLGFEFTAKKGYVPGARKVEAVRSFPTPTNVQQTRGILGLSGYFKRFIKDYSRIAAPLYNLTRKDVEFKWSQECENAFQMLKDALTSKPVLGFALQNERFYIDTDACKIGLSYVLYQDHAIIAFGSRSTNNTEKNYCATSLELLAIRYALDCSHSIIQLSEITLHTDHRPLVELYNEPTRKNSMKTQLRDRIDRWLLHISYYNLSLKYKKGKANVAADILSRNPLPSTEEPPKTYINELFDYDRPNDIDKVLEEQKLALENSSKQEANLQISQIANIDLIQSVKASSKSNISPRALDDETSFDDKDHTVPYGHDGQYFQFLNHKQQESVVNAIEPLDPIVWRSPKKLKYICLNIIAGQPPMPISSLQANYDENIFEEPVTGDLVPREPCVREYVLRHDLAERYPDINHLDDSQNDQDAIPVNITTGLNIGSLQDADPFLGPMKKFLTSGELPDKKALAKQIALQAEKFHVQNGTLFRLTQAHKKGRQMIIELGQQICIPTSLQKQAIFAAHDLSGHAALDKSFLKLKSTMWFQNMYSIMRKYIESCETCQRAMRNSRVKPPPLTPFSGHEYDSIFLALNLDIFGPLKESKGKKYILSCQDALSGWVEFHPMENITAEGVARSLIECWYSRYGSALKILSDIGSQFISEIFACLNSLWNVQNHFFTSSFEPQTNGQIEVSHKFLASTIRKCLIDEVHSKWTDFLPYACYAFRSTPTKKHLVSPAVVVFGQNLSSAFELLVEPTKAVSFANRNVIADFVQGIKLARKTTRYLTEEFHKASKHSFDKYSKIRKLNLNDLVYVYDPVVKPYVQSKKFTTFYNGPYAIDKVGKNDYYYIKDLRTNIVRKNPINIRRLKLCNLAHKSATRVRLDENERFLYSLNEDIESDDDQDDQALIDNEKDQMQSDELNLTDEQMPQATTDNDNDVQRDVEGNPTDVPSSDITSPSNGNETNVQASKSRYIDIDFKSEDIERVYNVKKQGRWFLCKFKQHPLPLWRPISKVKPPDDMIQELLKFRTINGKKRKVPKL